MILSRFLLVASLCCAYVSANMAPNYPEPGTIWKSGEQYTITWFDDKKSPSITKSWKKFKIDFMTGDNNNQKFLKNVATDLDSSSVKSFNWTAPEVEPHAAVYFLMFTNEKGQNAWTTRFGITGADGKLAKPENAVQPDGAKIPWGVGKVIDTSKSSIPSPNVSFSMTPAMASAAENNAAVVIAVSSAVSGAEKIKSLSSLVIFASFIMAYVFY